MKWFGFWVLPFNPSASGSSDTGKKEEKAMIFWDDEMALRSEHPLDHSYGIPE